MDIAKYIQIFKLEPDDDFVTKRRSAIRSLRTRFLNNKSISKLMTIGSDVCEVFCESSAIPDTLATQVETAIKNSSPSFVRDGRDLEMGVCAAMAVVQSFNSKSTKKVRDHLLASDVLAVALWSAASFLPTCNAQKLEEFRMFAVEAARNHILNASLETRARHNVPMLESSDDEEATYEEFKQATAPTVDALRINAALDREEIDLLWWVLSGRSEILEQRLLLLSPAERAVATGVEIGALMRALPTQSHRNLVLQGLDDADRVSLPSLLDELGKNRLVIAASFKDEWLIDDAPLVFPLLSAIRSGEGTRLGANLPRSLSEWGARALLERAILRIQHKDHWII
jgi:hypothetical protein